MLAAIMFVATSGCAWQQLPTMSFGGLQRLHGRGITHRIARRGVESSQRLGRHRWTIERAMARLACCRRLHRRYERKADWHRLHEMAQRVADSPHVATT